jgi:hypothetical protein
VRHADTPLRRLIVAADVHHYSTRDPLGQVDAQQALLDALTSAADAVQLDRSLWHRQPQGDAELAILPPETDEAAVVADLPRELAISLRRQNRLLKAEVRLRLRIAMHCGMLHVGALGYPGPAPVETCRLLDAPPLKRALAAAVDADLALIVSEQLFRDVVVPGYRGLRPELFLQVPVVVKEYSGNGYITLPESAAPPPGDSPGGSHAGKDPAPDSPLPQRPSGTWAPVRARAVTYGSGDAVAGHKIKNYRAKD